MSESSTKASFGHVLDILKHELALQKENSGDISWGFAKVLKVAFEQLEQAYGGFSREQKDYKRLFVLLRQLETAQDFHQASWLAA